MQEVLDRLRNGIDQLIIKDRKDTDSFVFVIIRIEKLSKSPLAVAPKLVCPLKRS